MFRIQKSAARWLSKSVSMSKWIGSRSFYSNICRIAVPIVVQNAISNFVNLLDNIMVGQTGTDPMNGVSVVNQLLFVFNLFVWGALSGASIFTAQYYGKGDTKGVRDTFRAKILMVVCVLVASGFALIIFGKDLISLFLHQTDGIGNAEATLAFGLDYLSIMLVGLVPLSIAMAYSNTLRGTGDTRLPMIAGVVSVFVNLVLNYVLIFGHFGAPAMGVSGAAVATVAARFVEAFIIIIYTHTHKERCTFIVGAYKSLKIPAPLLKQILIKGTPLALNEALWSLGLTFLTQCYSLRGLSVVAALNITSTISNLFNVVFFALGESISIIAGQLLGARKMEEAKDTVRKTLFMSVTVCVVIGGIMASLSSVFPSIYNTEQQVKDLASKFILVCSAMMPFCACMHGCYFTIRTGGRTMITFLFDSCSLWILAVPMAFCLSHFTGLNIVMIYLLVQCVDIFKAVLGVVLVKSGIWIQNIVEK